jgi:hypothetical protein
MDGQRIKHRLANKIVVAGVGILIIVGLVIMSKIFLKGFLAGIAFAGCAVTILWMMRTMRRKY